MKFHDIIILLGIILIGISFIFISFSFSSRIKKLEKDTSMLCEALTISLKFRNDLVKELIKKE